MKLNTPGNADGSLEAFVDGAQARGYNLSGSNPVGPNTNSSLARFSFVRIYAHQSGRLYYDDFCGGEHPIGKTLLRKTIR